MSQPKRFAKAAATRFCVKELMDSSELKRFGRYEIVAELGRGAMGVVYKARDPQIDRPVALKTIALWGQEPEEEKEFRLRFANEAQAAGRLHHPGIVSVFDVGEDAANQDPYIVLEYVSGESLQRVLGREKKLTFDKALKLAEELADALDYAHAQGVVHRDIKPANILVTEDGHAKIADFGIAKLNLAHFTIPGKVLGTPAYMAPEQLSGEGSDGRSDLFSLGVILYVMLTGHSPFPGSSATTVCFKVANREPVAASAMDMTLPPEIDALISRAIAKNPEDRYQKGAELADDLRTLQQAYKPGSTTTSLHAAGPFTRRLNLTQVVSPRNAKGRPDDAIAQAQTVVQHILYKAPVRDLILAGASVILLVILGAQSKLLVKVPKSVVAAVTGATQETDASSEQASKLVATAPLQQTPAAQGPVAPAKPARLRRTPKAQSSPPKPAEVPTATLDLGVQHRFKDATLFLYVDDKIALERPLHGGVQRKLIVFNGVRGVESESVQVPAGKHVLRIRALSTDHSIDLAKTVTVDFVGGDNKSLQVTFEKHNSMMRLNWE
jgi:serine/threonine protein kinase